MGIFDNLGGDKFKLFLCVGSNEIPKVWFGTDIMDSCNVYFSATSSSQCFSNNSRKIMSQQEFNTNANKVCHIIASRLWSDHIFTIVNMWPTLASMPSSQS